MFAFVTVSSACIAAPSDWIRFDLKSERGGSQIQASFHDESRGRDENHWSSGFKPSELIGLDVNGFYTAGAKPLSFAVVREAGRLDCAGNGGGSYASGNCRFSENPPFVQALLSRGIGRPNREQALGLMALDVHRSLVDALAAARYPTPSIDDLMALTAVGVTSRYINELAGVGYRPKTITSLTEFKALEISPEWISGIVRVGYSNLPSDELMQLKALEIDGAYIAGFQRAGYSHLPVDSLVQLKALDISPEFARSAATNRATLPRVDELVGMKLFGGRR
jgi:hypothetical protein